jgi:hypothetical protein
VCSSDLLEVAEYHLLLDSTLLARGVTAPGSYERLLVLLILLLIVQQHLPLLIHVESALQLRIACENQCEEGSPAPFKVLTAHPEGHREVTLPQNDCCYEEAEAKGDGQNGLDLHFIHIVKGPKGQEHKWRPQIGATLG